MPFTFPESLYFRHLKLQILDLSTQERRFLIKRRQLFQTFKPVQDDNDSI